MSAARQISMVLFYWVLLGIIVIAVGCSEAPRPLLEPGQHSRLLGPEETKQRLPACIARRDCPDDDNVVVDPSDGAIIAQPGPPMLVPYSVDPSLYKGLNVVPERLGAVAEIDKHGSHTERKVMRDLPKIQPNMIWEGTH